VLQEHGALTELNDDGENHGAPQKRKMELAMRNSGLRPTGPSAEDGEASVGSYELTLAGAIVRARA
jgi:hypothetical protein